MKAKRSNGEQSALYGIASETIAGWCQVHVTTVNRWKKGWIEQPPYAAMLLIELRSTGDLGVVDRDWRGWKIRDGKLISPDNMEFTTGDILAIPFLNQLVASYQADQRAPRQQDWIAERWIPAVEADVA